MQLQRTLLKALVAGLGLWAAGCCCCGPDTGRGSVVAVTSEYAKSLRPTVSRARAQTTNLAER